jgi:protein-disulfide isomerase
MATLKAPVTPRDHWLGPRDAAVVLVEYGDYQCPYCAAAQPVVHELLRSFGDDLALVFRHFPLSEIHPCAEIAAQAAEFAGAKRAFWKMHEALFANQPRLSVPTIVALAEGLDLPSTELRDALAAGTYVRPVWESFIGGVRSGVNGTPCFFVNGVRHDAPHDFPTLAAAVTAARRPTSPPRHGSEGQAAH